MAAGRCWRWRDQGALEVSEGCVMGTAPQHLTQKGTWLHRLQFKAEGQEHSP